MQNIFYICAVAGGSILVIQTLMMVFGFGGDEADIDTDVDVEIDGSGDLGEASSGFMKMLSVKTLIAAVTFFGATGMACLEYGLVGAPALAGAVGGGAAAFFIVGWLMNLLFQLRSEGNLDLGNAIGQSGRVYLRIPGERGGQGKVTVDIQGRRVQCKAMTSGAELATGTPVRVVGRVTADVLEVELIEEG